jgi:hypothetical protein
MIRRIVDRALGRQVSQDRAQELIVLVCDALKPRYANLNPVILDNVIWGYQSGERLGCF